MFALFARCFDLGGNLGFLFGAGLAFPFAGPFFIAPDFVGFVFGLLVPFEDAFAMAQRTFPREETVAIVRERGFDAVPFFIADGDELLSGKIERRTAHQAFENGNKGAVIIFADRADHFAVIETGHKLAVCIARAEPSPHLFDANMEGLVPSG